jgi:glucose-1-phosphate thymidylyltransferase
MWGILPAAGRGSRIQPLAFSKELLPVGSRRSGEVDRPVAVSEYIIERMVLGGITKLCFVIGHGKSDIAEYYGGRIGSVAVCYVVQDEPRGLCDALFRALPFIGDEERACFGLPDTIWFPDHALGAVGGHPLDFLLFPVARPEFFDAVELDANGMVLGVEVKAPSPRSHWIWGALMTNGKKLRELESLWLARNKQDEYLGTLVNAYLAQGGEARGVRAGRTYVDVGTLNGYREAMHVLDAEQRSRDIPSVERDGVQLARAGGAQPAATAREGRAP